MNHAQTEKFRQTLIDAAADQNTDPAAVKVIQQAYMQSPTNRRERRKQDRMQRHIESRAAHMVESGMSAEEHAALEQDGVEAGLPPGWLQNLIAQLPNILKFIAGLWAIFNPTH